MPDMNVPPLVVEYKTRVDLIAYCKAFRRVGLYYKEPKP